MTVSVKGERAADEAKIKRMVGRRIIKAEPCADVEGEHSNAVWMHGWRLTLDDGTVLSFMTEEHPDGGEYGTDIVLSRRVPT